MVPISVVTEESLHFTVEELRQHKFKGFDTETTGVEFSDSPFVLTLATEEKAYFIELTKIYSQHYLQEIFNEGVFFSHNAKFDALMLYKLCGIEMKGQLHCTMIIERLLNNCAMDLSLEHVAEVYGLEKDMEVDEYIRENDLYERRTFMDMVHKVPRYKDVPKELMIKYAAKDAWLHLQIGMKQRARLEELSK